VAACPILKQAFVNEGALACSGVGGDLSFGCLERLVRCLAGYFEALGVVRGERVAIAAKNSVLYLASFFALQRLGASAVLLSLQLRPEDWKSQLDLAHCRFVLGEEPYLGTLAGAGPRIIPFYELEHQVSNGAPALPQSGELSMENEVCVIFTSGSSGHNKGVCLSLGNFLSSAAASNMITGLAPGDSWIVSLPMYHVGGLGIIYRTLLSGASAFFTNSFSASAFQSIMSGNRITHLSLVPTMLLSLIEKIEDSTQEVNSYFKTLRSIIIAGASSSDVLLQKIKQYQLPVLSAWGMTETTAHCTCMSLDDSLDKIATVGRPFAHTKVRVVGEDGRELDAGRPGELIIKGPTVCLGYLTAEETPSPILDGWLHTGDLGVFDEEGLLTILGRKDDMFISGGENIHTAEIEASVSLHPNVSECAVLAVEDPKWGQRPVLFVVAKDPASFETSEIKSFLRDRLAKIKVPEQILLLDTLPRTAIGKTNYQAIRKLLQG
jgi:O-succinylbenzoic acid--CoA ligase